MMHHTPRQLRIQRDEAQARAHEALEENAHLRDHLGRARFERNTAEDRADSLQRQLHDEKRKMAAVRSAALHLLAVRRMEQPIRGAERIAADALHRALDITGDPT